MAIVKQEKSIPFNKLQRGAPFVADKTLYTRTNGGEDPKEHVFYKLNHEKAVTMDKRTVIHMTSDEMVTPCFLEKKQSKAAA
jgi:hypothetical protein